MAEPPGQAVLDDVSDVGAARGDAGDRGDMIGLKRVLHAQQKTQAQNSEHSSPARLTSSIRSQVAPPSGPHPDWNFPSAGHVHKPRREYALQATAFAQASHLFESKGAKGLERWSASRLSPGVMNTEKVMTKLGLLGAAAVVLSSAVA